DRPVQDHQVIHGRRRRAVQRKIPAEGNRECELTRDLLRIINPYEAGPGGSASLAKTPGMKKEKWPRKYSEFAFSFFIFHFSFFTCAASEISPRTNLVEAILSE